MQQNTLNYAISFVYCVNMPKQTLDDLLPLGFFCRNTCPTSMVYVENLVLANSKSPAKKERGEKNISMQLNNCHRNCIAYHYREYCKDVPNNP